MSFEEEFPSLKGIKVANNVLNREEIQKHCLDKQRVKEVIDSIKKEYAEKASSPDFPACVERKAGAINVLFDLEKELGL